MCIRDSGKSAFIDHNGKVISKTELFETRILTEKLEVKQTETPYSKYGNYLNYIFIVFGAITLLWPKNMFKKF